MVVCEAGFVANYVGVAGKNRQVTLRQTRTREEHIYGVSAPWIRSEACLRLYLGEGRMPGMLILASEDPHMFKPAQGTDLLAFLGSVFERSMRRWLG